MASPIHQGKTKLKEGAKIIMLLFSSGLNLRIICEELGTLKTEWHTIGVQLGIPAHKLNEFEKKDDPLSLVVGYWLDGNVPESEVPVSWESIVKALRSKYVGRPGLADRITLKYCMEGETTDNTG